jgi:hypothetical protein
MNITQLFLYQIYINGKYYPSLKKSYQVIKRWSNGHKYRMNIMYDQWRFQLSGIGSHQTIDLFTPV